MNNRFYLHRVIFFCTMTLALSSFSVQGFWWNSSRPDFTSPGLLFFKDAPAGLFDYQQHVVAPRELQKNESYHKAPEHVQHLMLEYAARMCRPGNERDRHFLEYLKEYGHLTVYDGPEKSKPNFFWDNPAEKFYISTSGGIFSAENSMDAQLSFEQRCILWQLAVVLMCGRTMSPAIQERINYRPAFFKDVSADQFDFLQHVFLPRVQQCIESDHKAPEHVQQLALQYATGMCRSGNELDRQLLEYLKDYGYLTIYDGPEKSKPNYFLDDPAHAVDISAFGGIFFPQGSLSEPLSPFQKETLRRLIAFFMCGGFCSGVVQEALGYRPAFFKDLPADQFNLANHVILPRDRQCTEGGHKAPEYVQELALYYATAMCRPGNEQDQRFLEYLREYGHLTVYDGSQNSDRGYFNRNRGTQAYVALNGSGGIFFPCGSFSAKLTPEQQHSIAHEVAHVMNGDTTQITAGNAVGSAAWFQHEYCAEKRAAETLYQLKNYGAIAANYRFIDEPTDPYYCGYRDTLALLIEQHPDDKQLRAIKPFGAKVVDTLYSCVRTLRLPVYVSKHDPHATWESRYEEYKARSSFYRWIGGPMGIVSCGAGFVIGATIAAVAGVIILKVMEHQPRADADIDMDYAAYRKRRMLELKLFGRVLD